MHRTHPPQASLKFPQIYRPKPSVTSQEVVNYKEHGAADDASAAEPDTCNQATEREEASPSRGKVRKRQHRFFYAFQTSYASQRERPANLRLSEFRKVWIDSLWSCTILMVNY